MNQKGNYIPKTNPNAAAAKMPPKIDNELIKKARELACNLVGFPCEVVIFEHPQHKRPFFRIEPDLKLVELNMIIYVLLKEFNIWYLEAHQVKSNKVDSVTCFFDLISAIHDFGMHWNAFRAIEPVRCRDVIALCTEANERASEEIAKMINK